MYDPMNRIGFMAGGITTAHARMLTAIIIVAIVAHGVPDSCASTIIWIAP
jgi:hypothetical protein